MARIVRRSEGRGPGARGGRRSVRPRLERLEGRDLPAVLVPTGVVATGVSASAIQVSWNASADPTVTGYNVYEHVWVPGSHGGKGSSTGGHYVNPLVGSNVKATSDTLAGYAKGTYHTFYVTAVGAAGASPFSLPATGETYIAPALQNGPTMFLLGQGAVWSGPVAATVGQTTQISLLISGNPLNFSKVSGPSTVTIDPGTGVVRYTPTAGDVGSVPVSFQATNPLGTVTQTVTFSVAAANPALATPKLVATATTVPYDGSGHQVAVVAYAADGVTRLNGTYAIAYNGVSGGAVGVGTYRQLVTFTSSDPNYSNATLLTTLTITPATPTFGGLSAPSIAAGAATATVSGTLGASSTVPVGEYVTVTLGGVSQQAVVGTFGTFSTTFNTAGLPAGNDPVSVSFAGDPNFSAASGSTTLTVVAPQAPKVAVPPRNVTTAEGDGASFYATATGSPVIAVQWQVSTDGGKTFANVPSNASAATNSLSILYATASMNGYQYRAIFTNSAGSVTTGVVTLTVEQDTGGGN